MPAIKQRYRIDLAEAFDRAFSNRSREFRDQLRPLINDPSVKSNIGREVVRLIRERTESGVDKNNKDFKPSTYSKGYQQSLQFKIYGKSASEVNLKLTGQMLANMQSNALSSSPSIVVDFASDLQNAKADGHIRGGGRNNTLPVRDFFGLPKKEEERIVREVVNEAYRSGGLVDIADFIRGA